jgi:hypothetical protein
VCRISLIAVFQAISGGIAMDLDSFYIFSQILFSLPAVAVAFILADYFRRRAAWRRRKRMGVKNQGFYPSAKAMGNAFQHLEVFTRPSMAYVLDAKEEAEVEEDDEGDPETLVRQLHRQLRRIRRGEAIERLVFRL